MPRNPQRIKEIRIKEMVFRKDAAKILQDAKERMGNEGYAETLVAGLKLLSMYLHERSEGYNLAWHKKGKPLREVVDIDFSSNITGEGRT